MRKFRPILTLVLSSAFCFAMFDASLYAATFKKILYPHSNSTSANGINDSNEIVGFYVDVSGVTHAYTYLNGTYKTIDPPGSSFAIAADINNSGVIVGGYGTTGTALCFIDKDGHVTNLKYPNTNQQGTQCWGINNKGTIVGTYILRNSQNQSRNYGFLYQGGKFQSLHVQGSTQTLPNGINDAGIVVGTYVDANGASNGFTYLNGKYTTVSYPGYAGASSGSDMNGASVLIGGYLANSFDHGFELIKGKYTTIDYPLKNINTALNRINKNGLIVGNYGGNYSPNTTGFLRTP